MDSLDFGGWGDLKSLLIDDNETHLLFRIEWFGEIPKSYYFKRYFRIVIDKLSISDWGSLPYSLIDFDEVVDVSQYSSGAIHSSNNVDVEAMDSSIEVAIPLDTLGVSENQVLRIMVQGPRFDYKDLIINEPIEVSIPSAKNIVIDGNPYDWINYTRITDVVKDIAEHNYPDMNITNIYLAMNGNILYIRADYELPFNITRYLGNTIDWSSYLEIHFGDGESERYVLDLSPKVAYFSNKEGIITWYSNYTKYYNVSWSGRCLEIALDISPIIKDLFIYNNTLYIHYLRYYTSVRDSVLNPYDVIKYVIGSGGIIISCIEKRSESLRRGTYSINIHDLSINVSLNDVANIDIYAYDNDLVTSKFLPLKSYILDITNPQGISWPIKVAIHYNESLINTIGLNEDDLAIYIYSSELNTYVRCRDTYVDTEANIVYAAISLDEFLANKFLLITVMSPEVALVPIYIPKTTTITKMITTKQFVTITKAETHTITRRYSLTKTKIITTPLTVRESVTRTKTIIRETTMTTTTILREPMYTTSIATLVLGVVIGIILYRLLLKK